MIQLTGRMASWSFASQLLLVALLSWTVCCFPARGVSGRSGPFRGVNPGFPPPPSNIHDPAVSYLVDRRPPTPHFPPPSSNLNDPAVSYLTDRPHPPPNFPPPPTDRNDPAVSFLVDRQNPPNFPPPPTDRNDPAVSFLVDRQNPPGFPPPPPPSDLNRPGVSYLVDSPGTSSSASRQPGTGILPVPTVYREGDLERLTGNIEHGDSERATRELGLLPPPSLFQHFYQGGELSNYASSFEHGRSERESEDQGFRRQPPFSGFTAGGGFVQSLPRPWRPYPPGDSYFLKGPASYWHHGAHPYRV